jgi:RNA polymerase sigma-70 factor (ECF subfamily)
LNDEKAVKALRRGKESALEWLIDRYAGYVNTIVYNIIGAYLPPPDVEEVASDVFLALWDNADRAQPDRLKAYLGSIARNRAKNKLRELGRDLPLDEDILQMTDGDTPEAAYLKRERTAAVKQAVLSMELPDREIFLRYYYYFQPAKTVAEEMNMNEATVRTRLKRGREKLKTTLSEGGYLYEQEHI